MATEHEAHTDHGTILKPTETALVVDEGGCMYMLTPSQDSDDEALTRLELFLTAVFIKAEDEEWVEELIQEAFYDVEGHC